MSMANIVQQQVSGTNYGQRHFAANGQSHSMGSQYGMGWDLKFSNTIFLTVLFFKREIFCFK